MTLQFQCSYQKLLVSTVTGSLCSYTWVVSGVPVCNSLGLKPPNPNNFNVTVGGTVYNMKGLVTTGAVDPSNGLYFQQVYTALNGYSYIFRLPIGTTSSTSYMPNGYPWNGMDANQVGNDGSEFGLGHYDGSSWVKNLDGSLTVSFTGGEWCASVGTTRSTQVTFSCLPGTSLTLSAVEPATCRYVIAVSGGSICSVIPRLSKSPSRKPSARPSAPTKRPTRSPVKPPKAYTVE